MERVDVCVCTYRRPSIKLTLATIARQRARQAFDLRVIVADNDAEPSARESIEAAARSLELPLAYVHAPAQNISIARNACLDEARADWLVFIDDDEAAPTDWLDHLLARRNDKDVVFGRSQALYNDPSTPHWMRAGDFHSNRMPDGERPQNGYTCNVLIRRELISNHDLRFDPALGQSGGEDTLFFEEADRAGARFGYAPDAVVYEEVPGPRARLGWLLRRRFRAGQTHYRLVRGSAPFPVAASLALAKVGYCGTCALFSIRSPERAAGHLLRGMLHLGFLAAAFGVRTYQEYAAPPGTPGSVARGAGEAG